jgi:hypothetical protein
VASIVDLLQSPCIQLGQWCAVLLCWLHLGVWQHLHTERRPISYVRKADLIVLTPNQVDAP